MECTVQQCLVDIPDVVACAAVVEAGDLVVAVLLGPTLGRNARTGVMQAVAEAVSQRWTGGVYVTADLDLYRQVAGQQAGRLRRTILARGNGVRLAPRAAAPPAPDLP